MTKNDVIDAQNDLKLTLAFELLLDLRKSFEGVSQSSLLVKLVSSRFGEEIKTISPLVKVVDSSEVSTSSSKC